MKECSKGTAVITGASAGIGDPRRLRQAGRLVTFPTSVHQTVRSRLLGVYSAAVAYLRKFGAVVLLAASFLAPVMACAANLPMTREERACCQTMIDRCGEGQMPASHNCCHKIPGSVYENALKVKAVALHSAVGPVRFLSAQQLGSPTSSISGWVDHRDYPPAQSPPSSISILRI